ncbi:MAG: hypothetical protein ACETWM_15965 [Candidatus Lokiarchaeia archaeon]
MVETRPWSILGMIGGLFGILTGIVFIYGGLAAQGNLQLYIAIVAIPELQPIEDVLLLLLEYISPMLAGFELGVLGSLLGFQTASSMIPAGIFVAIHGLLILIGAIMTWKGNKWGAVIMIIIGFIGTFMLNLGGFAGLIAGLVLWYEM